MHYPNLIQCPHCGQPYSAEQGKQWLGQTQVCRNCDRLFMVEEQAGELRTVATGRRVLVDYAPAVPVRRTDGVSVAALVTGIVGLIVPLLPAVAAVVLGAMGLRRTGSPEVGGRGYAVAGLVLGIVGILLVPVVLLAVLGVRGATVRTPAPPPIAVQTLAYYTVDGGQTLFVDSIDRIAPFEHEGEQAVRAHVFTCDGGQTTFVGYLERHSVRAKQIIDQANENWDMEFDFDELMRAYSDFEVRKPGPEQEWVNSNAAPRAARELTDVRCPDEDFWGLQPVLP